MRPCRVICVYDTIPGDMGLRAGVHGAASTGLMETTSKVCARPACARKASPSNANPICRGRLLVEGMTGRSISVFGRRLLDVVDDQLLDHDPSRSQLQSHGLHSPEKRWGTARISCR